MLTQLNSCSAKDIREVNQQKEYTLISTKLLQCLFTDSRINSHAVKCWQLLFNKARFNSNLEVTISYNALAKELGRSKRTIMRYIQMLSKSGYLEVLINSNSRQGFQPNTLFIRVPTFIIETVKTSKNRTDRKSFINNECIVSTNKVLTDEYGDASTINSVSISKPIVSTMEKQDHQSSAMPKTILDTNLSEVISLSTKLNPQSETQLKSSINLGFDDIPIESEEKETTLFNRNPSEEMTEVTKMSLPPNDKDVTLLINNKIKRNNNNVVDFFNLIKSNSAEDSPADCFQSTENKIAQINEKIKYWENIDRQEGSKLSNFAGDHAAIDKHLEYLGSIRSQIHIMKIALEELKKHGSSLKEKYEKESLLNTKVDYFFKKRGGKLISLFTFKRLVRSLESYGYNDNKLVLLINEIIFEVKFGSLAKNDRGGGEILVDHAINIALKLVRENRWSTPIPFKNGTCFSID